MSQKKQGKKCNDKCKNTIKIVGTYTDDYDITYVDRIIENTILLEKEKIPELEAKLKLLNQQIFKPQTLNARKEMEAEITSLNTMLHDLKLNKRLKEYQELAKPHLDTYNALKRSENDICVNEKNQLLVVINRYLSLAKKYIIIEVTRNVTTKDCCLYCKTELTPNDVVGADGIIKCPNCANEHQMINVTKCNDGAKDQNLNTENDMENFIKALTRYQGLQPNPPMIILSKLDTYFKQRKQPTAEQIKKLPYNDRGKKGNTNKEMLCHALSQIGYASYYEDVNLIGHLYWDWKLPDLTGLKDTILRHYTITQKAFYKIPLEVRGRISSLGTQYRLWRHLQLIGHICYAEDFKIAENPDSLQNHHRLWKLMCELANDPEIYFVD